MAIVNDQAFSDNFDPGAPPTLPASVTVIALELNDVDNNGVIDTNGDIVNGSPVNAVYNGDTITMNGVVITGATIYTDDGGRYFTPTDDTILQGGTITDVGYVTVSTQLNLTDFGPPCLTKGTLVETYTGPVRVEEISTGDLVRTKDNGYQPVKWMGHSTVAGSGSFAPICFTKGSLGNNQNLRVSPEHRMLLSGPKCELMFSESEVLCAAKHLVPYLEGAYVDQCETIDYYHIMFEQHEIIFTEGAETESFFLGSQIASANRETYLEIGALFPELVSDFKIENTTPARMFLKNFEAAALHT